MCRIFPFRFLLDKQATFRTILNIINRYFFFLTKIALKCGSANFHRSFLFSPQVDVALNRRLAKHQRNKQNETRGGEDGIV